MTTIRNIFFTFILACMIAVLMSGCGAIMASKALMSGPERIDVKERLEQFTLDYECRPRAYDEELDGRREKHSIHIECYNINEK